MSQESSPARRGRRRTEAPGGRDALLRAATRAFADHGFDAAGVRTIAAAANVAPNLVVVHFGSKAGLWLACVESLEQALGPKIAALRALSVKGEGSVGRRLAAAIDMTSAYYEQNPDLRGFIARGGLEPPPRGDIIAERLLRPLFEPARPLIQEGIDAGLIPIDDPAIVFVLLHAALGQPDRLASAMAVLSPDKAPKDAPGQIAEALKRLLSLRPEARSEGS